MMKIFLLALSAVVWFIHAASAVQCPPGLDGFTEVVGCKCYHFTERKGIWNTKFCTENGGMLAKIADKRENDYIREKVRVLYGGEDGAWIGATRESRDKPFQWPDGSELHFTNWADGEPDHILFMDQNCAYLTKLKHWAWASLQCGIVSYRMPYVCQYEIQNCTLPMQSSTLSTGAIIGIVVGSVVGAVVIALLISWIVVCCKSGISQYKKKKQQERSIRYYSGVPQAEQRRSVQHNGRENEECENDVNEHLMAVGDNIPVENNAKGKGLPTATSINAEAEGSRGLIVDIHTGRATIKKRNNSPEHAETGSRQDDVSTRSLKSFIIDSDAQPNHYTASHTSDTSQPSTSNSNYNIFSANLDSKEDNKNTKTKALEV